MTAVTFYRSTIGKKVVMALSGLILVGFVFLHMVGNLKVYEGAAKINAYGHFLREVGSPVFGHSQLLWIVRLVLLASVGLHIAAAAQLTLADRASRPTGYRRRGSVQASYASRTMRWGGVIVLLFIIYHLLHFTTGTVHPDFREGEVYHNMVSGFQVWYVSAFYILAMVALGLHLQHGIWSLFQTLGLNNGRYNRLLKLVAVGIALLIVLGNISIPIAVLAGVVK